MELRTISVNGKQACYTQVLRKKDFLFVIVFVLIFSLSKNTPLYMLYNR